MNSSEKLSFRRITINDSNVLLRWRNDSQTRKSSRNSSVIRLEKHTKWLTASLKDKNRKIYIVEHDGIPVGTIRTDNLRGVTELSWTVAPEMRGRGIGKKMVALFANHISGPIQVGIKVNNEASKCIAEYVNMKFDHEEGRILYYTRSNIGDSKNEKRQI